MNSTLKNILIFVGGAGIGALAATIVAKKKFETEYQVVYEDKDEKETISIYDGNGNVIDEVCPDSEATKKETSSTDNQTSKQGTVKLVDPNYKKIARGYSNNDEEGREPAEKEDYTKYERMSKKSEGVNDSPYVISVEEFSEGMEHYDKITLYYYEDDDTLADPDESIITDPNALVGECLTKFGEESEDPEVVFVRNDKLSIDYEVIRLSKSFSETVLGYANEEKERTRPARRGRLDD